jgi:hypothetical protein
MSGSNDITSGRQNFREMMPTITGILGTKTAMINYGREQPLVSMLNNLKMLTWLLTTEFKRVKESK